MKAAASDGIRQMRSEDADAAFALVREAPGAAQWTEQDFRRAAELGYNVWIAEKDGRIAAVLVSRHAADEMEILNLAVATDARQRGIARELVQTSAAKARASGIHRIFLEVRVSNVTAISFYQGIGFSRVGLRKAYYFDPPDDAVLMSVSLK